MSVGTSFIPKVPVISLTIQSSVDCWYEHFAVSNAHKEDCTSAEPFLSAFSRRFSNGFSEGKKYVPCILKYV